VANNEDYYFDFEPYIQIEPRSDGEMARLWYGWDNRAQGGVNEAGLFYDVAVTPHQGQIKGRYKLESNLGDEMLSKCKNIEEALQFVESLDLLLPDAHIMFGDASGNAVVVEWIGHEKRIIHIEDDKLVMTNFLLAKPEIGGYPCWRYNTIEKGLRKIRSSESPFEIKMLGDAISPAVQKPRKQRDGKKMGTVYTSFINISDMKFALFYEFEDIKRVKLDLKKEFELSEKKKIELN